MTRMPETFDTPLQEIIWHLCRAAHSGLTCDQANYDDLIHDTLLELLQIPQQIRRSRKGNRCRYMTAEALLIDIAVFRLFPERVGRPYYETHPSGVLWLAERLRDQRKWARRTDPLMEALVIKNLGMPSTMTLSGDAAISIGLAAISQRDESSPR